MDALRQYRARMSRLGTPAVVAAGIAALLAVGCSPAVTSETTTTSAVRDEASTTTASSTTTTVVAVTDSVSEGGTTSTTSSQMSDDYNCLNYWSEEFVQETAGSQYTFDDMNNDGTLCAFTATPNSIGVFFRQGDQGLFDQSKAGAAITGTQIEFTDVCDDAWYLDSVPLIAEAYSADQGLIFNATLVGPDDPVGAATELLMVACAGPQFQN